MNLFYFISNCRCNGETCIWLLTSEPHMENFAANLYQRMKFDCLINRYYISIKHTGITNGTSNITMRFSQLNSSNRNERKCNFLYGH